MITWLKKLLCRHKRNATVTRQTQEKVCLHCGKVHRRKDND